MKTLKLATKGDVLLFLSNFEPRSAYKDARLVRELNKLLDWRISGSGCYNFANILLGIPGNLAAMPWCTGDQCRIAYAGMVCHCVQGLSKTTQYPYFASYIKLPSWAYLDPQKLSTIDPDKLRPFS
jgi:hypothetical protein